MGERVSLRAYALHRDCTLAAVQKAIESGRLLKPAFGRDAQERLEWIDVELADRQWSENTDPAAAAKAGKTITPPPLATGEESDGQTAPTRVAGNEGTPSLSSGEPGLEGGTLEELELGQRVAPAEDLLAHAAETGATSSPPASSSASDYQRARAQREHYQAQQAQLDYLRSVGELVLAADVREATFKRYRGMRDALLNIPDRVATILAAERDPARVHAALTEELKRVLSDLSNDAAADATGGAPERVAA